MPQSLRTPPRHERNRPKKPDSLESYAIVAGLVPCAEPDCAVGSVAAVGIGPDDPEQLVDRHEGVEVILQWRARLVQ